MKKPTKADIRKVMSHIGKNGALKQARSMTPAQRSARARNAALKRWRKKS